jgi:hypothetical protein
VKGGGGGGGGDGGRPQAGRPDPADAHAVRRVRIARRALRVRGRWGVEHRRGIYNLNAIRGLENSSRDKDYSARTGTWKTAYESLSR